MKSDCQIHYCFIFVLAYQSNESNSQSLDWTLPLKYSVQPPSFEKLRQSLHDSNLSLAAKLDTLFSDFHNVKDDDGESNCLTNMKDMIHLFSQATYTVMKSVFA